MDKKLNGKRHHLPPLDLKGHPARTDSRQGGARDADKYKKYSALSSESVTLESDIENVPRKHSFLPNIQLGGQNKLTMKPTWVTTKVHKEKVMDDFKQLGIQVKAKVGGVAWWHEEDIDQQNRTKSPDIPRMPSSILLQEDKPVGPALWLLSYQDQLQHGSDRVLGRIHKTREHINEKLNKATQRREQKLLERKKGVSHQNYYKEFTQILQKNKTVKVSTKNEGGRRQQRKVKRLNKGKGKTEASPRSRSTHTECRSAKSAKKGARSAAETAAAETAEAAAAAESYEDSSADSQSSSRQSRSPMDTGDRDSPLSADYSSKMSSLRSSSSSASLASNSTYTCITSTPRMGKSPMDTGQYLDDFEDED